MHPDRAREGDDPFADRLAAYDEAVASGRLAPLPPDTTTPAHLQSRLARAQAVVERLERDRVRRGYSDRDTTAKPLEAPGVAYDADGNLTQLDRFQILRPLGTGGAGTVYLAFDTRLQKQVAVKVPRLEVLAAPSLRYRFLREARTAAGFDHPNLIAVHETGEIGPICYMVSAYCPGTSLREWFARHEEVTSPRDAAHFLAMVADAVGYIHERGVVHRDLKPGNILLERSASAAPELEESEPGSDKSVPPVAADWNLGLSHFTPKISDFGLAKWLDADDGQTRSGTVLGTPRYMAPEQAEGRVRVVGPHSDVYALGVIFYELLTRQTPSWEAEAKGPMLVSPRKLNPELPRELDGVCRKCLERAPEERYASAVGLAGALRDFLRHHSDTPWLSRVWRAVGRVRQGNRGK
jgi:serine/threonine-protein kinase